MIFNKNSGFTEQETALIKKRLNEFEAACLRKTVTGTPFITVDDTSPLTHTVKVKLISSRPYDSKTWTAVINNSIYTADKDGNIYGVESRYPNMSFAANNPLDKIEATYLVDLNKALNPAPAAVMLTSEEEAVAEPKEAKPDEV